MKYIEVRITAESSATEVISAILDTAGIDRIVVKDPNDLKDIINNKEKYWYDFIEKDLTQTYQAGNTKAEISFFLEENDEGRAKLEEVRSLEEKMKQAAGAFELTRRIVDDEDWKDKWKEFFKPVRITENITVKPTWEEYSPEEGETVIEIDPGMAFGTGTHETTSSCIILMEKYLKDGFRVLDVGCGSGILSIAAALMGCEDVTGVDLDPDAVEAAIENVRTDHVEDRVKILKGDLAEGLDIKADLIVANLAVNLIERLLSDISAHLADGGVFIASGILTEQQTRAEEAIRAQGLEISEVLIKGDWCTIAAEKQ